MEPATDTERITRLEQRVSRMLAALARRPGAEESVDFAHIESMILDLDGRVHTLEGRADQQFAGEFSVVLRAVADVNARVHNLEARVTRLEIFSLGRPEPVSPEVRRGNDE